MHKKYLTIIPTTHAEIESYSSEHLFSYMHSLEPDVVFEELPGNLHSEIWKSTGHPGQEEKAISRLLEVLSIPHLPVDLPFRNDIAKEIDLYAYQVAFDKIFSDFRELGAVVNRYCERYQNQWDSINAHISSEGIKYLLSSRFEKAILRKNRIEKALIFAYERAQPGSILRLYELNEFFHSTLREKMIVQITLNRMVNFERGVLLIGAEHRGIVQKFKNTKHPQNLDIGWIRI